MNTKEGKESTDTKEEKEASLKIQKTLEIEGIGVAEENILMRKEEKEDEGAIPVTMTETEDTETLIVMSEIETTENIEKKENIRIESIEKKKEKTNEKTWALI